MVEVFDYNLPQDVSVSYCYGPACTTPTNIFTGDIAGIARVHYTTPTITIAHMVGKYDISGCEHPACYTLNYSMMRVVLKRDGEVYSDYERTLVRGKDPGLVRERPPPDPDLDGVTYKLNGLKPLYKPGVPQVLGYTIYVPRHPEEVGTEFDGVIDWVELVSAETTVTVPEVPQTEITKDNIGLDVFQGYQFAKINLRGRGPEDFLINPVQTSVVTVEATETDIESGAVNKTTYTKTIDRPINDLGIESLNDEIIETVAPQYGHYYDVDVNIPPSHTSFGTYDIRIETTITGDNFPSVKATILCTASRIHGIDPNYPAYADNQYHDTYRRSLDCEVASVTLL